MNTRKETAFPSLRMRLDTSRFSSMQYSAEALYIRTANLSHCPFHSIRSMTAIMMPFTGEASISYGQFPHDAWWDEGTFSFSDGSELVVKLEKKDGPQEFTFEKKTVSSLSLDRLIKSSDPSPFPALIQLEVYGNDC